MPRSFSRPANPWNLPVRPAELNHLAVTGTTPQGQPISLDFWVDDNRKLIKIAVPSQGVEAYQDGLRQPRSSRRCFRTVRSSEGRLVDREGFYELAGKSSQPRRAARRTAAAVECYLSAILEIAEAIEAISPEIGSSYREPLTRLHAGLRLVRDLHRVAQ